MKFLKIFGYKSICNTVYIKEVSDVIFLLNYDPNENYVISVSAEYKKWCWVFYPAVSDIPRVELSFIHLKDNFYSQLLEIRQVYNRMRWDIPNGTRLVWYPYACSICIHESDMYQFSVHTSSELKYFLMDEHCYVGGNRYQ